jgi:hypothetical protein
VCGNCDWLARHKRFRECSRPIGRCLRVRCGLLRHGKCVELNSDLAEFFCEPLAGRNRPRGRFSICFTCNRAGTLTSALAVIYLLITPSRNPGVFLTSIYGMEPGQVIAVLQYVVLNHLVDLTGAKICVDDMKLPDRSYSTYWRSHWKLRLFKGLCNYIFQVKTIKTTTRIGINIPVKVPFGTWSQIRGFPMFPQNLSSVRRF